MSGLARRASPRLAAYALLAAGGLFAAVVAGRPEVVALVAPAALLALAGVVLAEEPEVRVRVELARDRTLEGEPVDGTVVVEVTGRGRTEVLVPVTGVATVAVPTHGRAAWVVHGPGPHRLPFVLDAPRWGVGRLGAPLVRVHGPLGLVRWEGVAGTGASLRVLPPVATLRRLLEPDEPRAAAGVHLTRRRAEGIEFADVRPYAPGDRLRSVNWAVSSRKGALWVTQRHPERAADLVLLVDTFADDPDGGLPALVPAVRAAWCIASGHLRAYDRVGLVTFGGYPAWLAPGGGDRARYALLDRLLAAQAAWTEAQRSVRFVPPGVLPPGAVVVALTPLHDRRTLDALLDVRRRGLRVLVVELALPAPDDEAVPGAARRLWAMELDRRRTLLEAGGCRIVTWHGDGDASMLLDSLARLEMVRRGGSRVWAGA